MEAFPAPVEGFEYVEQAYPLKPVYKGTSSNKRKLDSYIEKFEIFSLLRALILAKKAATVLKIGSFVHF